MTEQLLVTCVICDNTFECFSILQAHGCAADIKDGYIIGHYGSVVADTMCLTIDPKQVPLLPHAGVICDECITRWEGKGMIIDKRVRDAFEDL